MHSFRRRGRAWHEHEDARLIELYSAGEQFEEIAGQLDRSLESVRSRASTLRKGGRLKVRRRVAPIIEREAAQARVAELWAAGKTYREIAAALNLKASTVGVWLHALRARGDDVARRRPAAWSDTEVALGRDLLAGGRTLDEVAEQLARPVAAVQRRFGDFTGSSRWSAWSREDDARLVAGYRDGLTLDALARQLGRGSDAVFGRIQRLRRDGVDLPPRRPRWTPAEQRRLLVRRAQGATYVQLAREFGRSKGSISVQLRRLRRATALES